MATQNEYDGLLMPIMYKYKLAKLKRRPFILVEGSNFSGKTTFSNELKSYIEKHYEIPIVIEKEPSNNSISRSILNSDELEKFFKDHKYMGADTRKLFEYYFFMASRAHSLSIVAEKMKDNLIILDRSFISTCVFQHRVKYILNLNILKENILLYETIGQEIFGDKSIMFPDIIFYLKIDAETYIHRMKSRGSAIDDFDDINISDIENKINMYNDVFDSLKDTKYIGPTVVTLDMSLSSSNTMSSAYRWLNYLMDEFYVIND